MPGRSQRLLWAVCGLALVAFSALWPIHAVLYQEIAWDFPQFYIAARLPAGSLFDREAFAQMGREIFAGTPIHYFPPFVRPAVFAVPLRPLGLLSYWNAFWLWSSIQIACSAALLLLVRRIYAYPPEFLLGWALFYPMMHWIWEGQDAPAVALVLLLVLMALRAGRQRAAGILLALSCYKFNLVLLLPLLLVALRQWRALGYAAGGTAALAAISCGLESPRAYLHLLGRIPDITVGFDVSAMPGLRRLTGGVPWLYASGAALVTLAAWLAMRRTTLTQGFAIAVSGSLLIAYHLTYYDLTSLVIPIAVALQNSSRWTAKAAAFLLLAGVPLWLAPPYWVAGVAATLFMGLVFSALAPPPPQSDTPGQPAAPPSPAVR